MTHLRLVLLSALLLGAVGARESAAPAAPSTRPNVLFIVIDDLRDWVGYLGRHPQAKTPNLDRLAARGVAFTHAYTAAPSCNPSRAAALSGLRPSTSGVYENDNDWRTVVPEEMTLPSTFRRAGYFVCGAGKVYHTAYPRRSEWDDYLEEEKGGNPKPAAVQGAGTRIKFGPVDGDESAMRDYKIVDYAIAQLSRPRDQPLFLAVGIHKPHLPWFVPRKYFDLHPLDGIELPPRRDGDLDDVPEEGRRLALQLGDHEALVKADLWKPAVQAYLAATSFADAMIGRLIDALERSPLRDNTVICLWSDHGWSLGEKEHWRKFALWENETRSPMIWVVPGLTPRGAECARTVDLMGLYPTLCEVAGVPAPAHVEGTSFRSLLADPTAPWDRPAVTTYLHRNHSVRAEAWRYTRYFDGTEELYDETADPNEWRNLAAESSAQTVKRQLAAWLPAHNQDDLSGSNRRKSADD
jgi:arylsulfatase A-like enzyme